MIQKYAIFRFSKKTGKVDTTLSCGAFALAKLYALQNTTATKNTIVIDAESGNVVFVVSGRKDAFPKVCESPKIKAESLGITQEILQSVCTD